MLTRAPADHSLRSNGFGGGVASMAGLSIASNALARLAIRVCGRTLWFSFREQFANRQVEFFE